MSIANDNVENLNVTSLNNNNNASIPFKVCTKCNQKKLLTE